MRNILRHANDTIPGWQSTEIFIQIMCSYKEGLTSMWHMCLQKLNMKKLSERSNMHVCHEQKFLSCTCLKQSFNRQVALCLVVCVAELYPHRLSFCKKMDQCQLISPLHCTALWATAVVYITGTLIHAYFGTCKRSLQAHSKGRPSSSGQK